MKQKWIAFFAVLTLCIAFPMSVFAASSSSTSSTIPDHRLQPRVVDNANLLTASEEQELEKYLDSISEDLKFDIAVVTTDTINGKTPMAYADDFYDYNGYGYGDDRSTARCFWFLWRTETTGLPPAAMASLPLPTTALTIWRTNSFPI